MDEKLLKALEKKMDEFIDEASDEEGNFHFFFGTHTPEIMANAAAAVFDGMEHATHCATRLGIYDDDKYASAADFIKAARLVEAEERSSVTKATDELAKEVQPA